MIAGHLALIIAAVFTGAAREVNAVLDRLQREPDRQSTRDALGRGRRGVRLGVRPPFGMPRCRRCGTALPISRPQNRGAVSRRARNQIERNTIPNYCKLFNEFSP